MEKKDFGDTSLGSMKNIKIDVKKRCVRMLDRRIQLIAVSSGGLFEHINALSNLVNDGIALDNGDKS
jgi:hypothetical protein